MSHITHLQEILDRHGLSAQPLDLGNGVESPLVVALRDDADTVRQLFVETVPRGQGDAPDDVEVVAFLYIYPYIFADLEVVPETLRLLFFLNRLLPVGAHQFAEEAPGMYFSYHLITPSILELAPNVLLDTIGMISMFTKVHGALIERVAHGTSDCASIIEELEAQGMRPGPLFGTPPAQEAPGREKPQRPR